MHKGHGNTHKHQRRYRKYFDEDLYRDEEFLLIDGNYTHYPYKHCKVHQGFLSRLQVELHNCEKIECTGLGEVDDFLEQVNEFIEDN